MQTATHPVSRAADAPAYLIFSVVGALLAATAAGLTHDLLFRFHAYIFLAAGVVSAQESNGDRSVLAPPPPRN